MKAAVIAYPGSNCEYDTYYVLNNVLNIDTDLLWHTETDLKKYDLIVVPGGFSFGDYLRAGAMAKISPVSLALIEEAQKNKYILGICNGFQILTELKLLPGALIPNKSLRFICKFVDLKVINKNTPFTWKVKKDILKIPIAHFQGNYYIDEKNLQILKKNNQIVLKYVDNPNGSIEDIAGIINKNQNVFALMPHPERASEHILGREDGRYLFESIIESIKKG